MHQQHLTRREVIPIMVAPPDGQMTEAFLLEQLVWKYGPTLNRTELLEVTKVSNSSAGNFTNEKHQRCDPQYPKGFPLFDSDNSPCAYFAVDAAKWLFTRYTKHINSNKV